MFSFYVSLVVFYGEEFLVVRLEEMIGDFFYVIGREIGIFIFECIRVYVKEAMVEYLL